MHSDCQTRQFGQDVLGAPDPFHLHAIVDEFQDKVLQRIAGGTTDPCEARRVRLAGVEVQAPETERRIHLRDRLVVARLQGNGHEDLECWTALRDGRECADGEIL